MKDDEKFDTHELCYAFKNYLNFAKIKKEIFY
jgi:hypothetical protein